MIAVIVAATLGAHAADREAHTAAFAESRSAGASLRFEDQLWACADAIRADPLGPGAAPCRRTMVLLEARRDPDGTFTGWRAFEAARTAWTSAGPDVTRAQITTLTARPLSDTAAVEVTTWLAEDALRRLGDPTEANRWSAAAWAGLPSLGEETALRLRATDVHVEALALSGRDTEARNVAAASNAAGANANHNESVDRVTRARRLRHAAAGSGVVLAASTLILLIGAAIALRRKASRWPWPTGPALLALSGIGGGAIAEAWSHGAAASVLPWFVGATGVNLVAFVALQENPRAAARVLLRASAATATLAVAYLCLWGSDALAWFGL